MGELELNIRKKQVLSAIIYDYILTAEPVGSRVVAKKYGLGLSPATIRNTMADLEDMGYITQPHTSAGRMPTDKGYRFYVDSMVNIQKLTPKEESKIQRQYHDRKNELDEIMQVTSFHLSMITNYTGVVLAPPLRNSLLERIDFIKLDGNRVLLLIVSDSGWITNKIVALESEVNNSELKEISKILTERFAGMSFDVINNVGINVIEEEASKYSVIMQKTKELAQKAFSLMKGKNLYLGGTLNILDYPEFCEIHVMKSVLGFLEEKKNLVDLLTKYSRDKGVNVIIGHENPYIELQECSIISSPYKYGDRVLGILGIIGPKRMPYSRVISVVDYTSKLISRFITRLGRSYFRN